MAEVPQFIDLGIHRDQTYGYVGTIIHFVFIAYLIFIVFFHGHKMYQDLYTKQRKSLNHRRKKSTITTSYKLMLYLCESSNICWLLGSMMMLSSYFSHSDRGCEVRIAIGATFGGTAKALMYLLFLVRLDSIYGSSAYGYSVLSLKISGALIITYNIFIILFSWFIWESQVHEYGSVHSYPNWCAATFELITLSLYVFFDSIASFAFLVAFIVPLRKTIKLIKEAHSDQDHHNKKTQIKIVRIGFKTTILTMITIVSTFTFATFTTVTELNFGMVFDTPFNTICMILMTPYYPDPIYFDRMCCLCIKLCSCLAGHRHEDDKIELNKDKAESTMHSELETQTKTVTDTAQTKTITLSPTSVDTMDQLQHTVKQVALNVPANNDNYDPLKDQRDITPEPTEKATQ